MTSVEELERIRKVNAETMAAMQRRADKMHPVWGKVDSAKDSLHAADGYCGDRDLENAIFSIEETIERLQKALELARALTADEEFK